MMKRLLLIPVALLPYVVMYLLGSFVAVSFNPADWAGEGRFLAAGLSTLAAFIGVMGLLEVSEK
jgi:hypothetical protein